MVSIDKIMSYENGDMEANDILRMFAELVKDKSAWHLQGHYGRTAEAFIQDGFITRSGELTAKAREFIKLNKGQR